MYRIFSSFLRFSLEGEVVVRDTLTSQEWHLLFEMAKKQGVVGVCFAGIQRLSPSQRPPEKLYFQWLALVANIQQKNEFLNKQCVFLQQKFLANGLKTCILKGQGMSSFYGTFASLRQSGDIDIWVKGTRKEVLFWGERLKIHTNFDWKHIHWTLPEGTEVEVHWTPSTSYNPFRNQKLKTFYATQASIQWNNRVNLPNNVGEITTPTATFYAIYLMIHLFDHTLYEGIGLRQVLDFYFVLLTREVQEAKENIVQNYKNLGILRFAGAIMYVMQEVFAVEESFLLCPVQKKEGEKLLQEIWIGGNFGHDNLENQVDKETFFQRMKRRLSRRLRLLRYDPLSIFFTPFFKMGLLLRRKFCCKTKKS